MFDVLTVLFQITMVYLAVGLGFGRYWKSRACDLRKDSVCDLERAASSIQYWEASKCWYLWPISLWQFARMESEEWGAWSSTKRLEMLEKLRRDAERRQKELQLEADRLEAERKADELQVANQKAVHDARLRRMEARMQGGVTEADTGSFPDTD